MKLVRTNVGGFSGYNTFFDELITKELVNRRQLNSDDLTLPAVNILENDNEFIIELAAPGLKKEDFNLELDNSKLEISVKNNSKVVDEKSELVYSRKDFGYGNFTRSFTVPSVKINVEDIKAEYENGVLRVNLPKREEAKARPVKMIEVA